MGKREEFVQRLKEKGFIRDCSRDMAMPPLRNRTIQSVVLHRCVVEMLADLFRGSTKEYAVSLHGSFEVIPNAFLVTEFRSRPFEERSPSSIVVPTEPDVIADLHSHPNGMPEFSPQDMKVMQKGECLIYGLQFAPYGYRFRQKSNLQQDIEVKVLVDGKVLPLYTSGIDLRRRLWRMNR